MATISLCMIVKNESCVLRRCLESIKNCVDEIIIIDTGSSDETITIAREYTELVYSFPWCDDFSAARNTSFSRATMDYRMWLDADDVLTEADQEKLLLLKATLSAEDEVVCLPYHTSFDEQGEPTFTFYRERLISKSVPHRWVGRVHEVVEHSGKVRYADAAVRHHSVKTSYSDRNLHIYQTQKANGEPFSPRDRFYYARELYYHEHYGEAAREFVEFLKSGQGWKENCIEACRWLSRCLEKQELYDLALDALLYSFRYDAPRAVICCEIGRLWMQRKQWEHACAWYEQALQCTGTPDPGAFVDVDAEGFLPCIQLCVCYDRQSQPSKARAYHERAAAYRPNHPAVLHNQAYFETRHES